jgi:hypothetical protein
MPRQTTITPDLIAEVTQRRAAAEPWKAIENDLRARGLPFGRVTFWRHGVSKHLHACDETPPGCTA